MSSLNELVEVVVTMLLLFAVVLVVSIVTFN